MSGILEKAQETLSRATADAGKKMQELNQNDKIKQMSYDTKEPSPKSRFTTNTGMGVDNTDVWLKVAGDKQGPSLLQDHHGREKVHLHRDVLIRSTISIMKEFRNVWFMLVAPPRMESSAFMKRFRNCLAPTFSTIHRMKLPSFSDFPRSWDLEVPRIRFETSVVLQSSSTLVKEIGISLETIFPSSSSKTQSSFQISYTPVNQNRRQKCRRLNPRTTTFGISKGLLQKLPICSCG